MKPLQVILITSPIRDVNFTNASICNMVDVLTRAVSGPAPLLIYPNDTNDASQCLTRLDKALAGAAQDAHNVCLFVIAHGVYRDGQHMLTIGCENVATSQMYALLAKMEAPVEVIMCTSNYSNDIHSTLPNGSTVLTLSNETIESAISHDHLRGRLTIDPAHDSLLTTTRPSRTMCMTDIARWPEALNARARPSSVRNRTQLLFYFLTGALRSRAVPCIFNVNGVKYSMDRMLIARAGRRFSEDERRRVLQSLSDFLEEHEISRVMNAIEQETKGYNYPLSATDYGKGLAIAFSTQYTIDS